MKPAEQKAEFIKLRAEGKSYSAISKELNISKSTCTSWERELTEQIAELKQEQLQELYSSYYMTREARIKNLGGTLQSINDALEGADLTQIAPERLLDYKLKYTEALKGEYIGGGSGFTFSGEPNPQEALTALGDLLNRIRAGEITAEQAARESAVIANLLKAYEDIELKAKLEALETILGGRAQ